MTATPSTSTAPLMDRLKCARCDLEEPSNRIGSRLLSTIRTRLASRIDCDGFEVEHGLRA